MLKITHIAHSCFLIENNKESLLIDPYDSSIGYAPIRKSVNYLLISHNHYDHNCTDNIEVKDNIGSFKIEKVNSYHDEQQGSKRGKNIIHIIDTENTRICHLGDLGHILTNEQLPSMQGIDVLLIPVGANYTIDYKKAIEIIKQLNPMTVIPMHYKTGKINLDIDTVDKFIKEIEKEYKVVQTGKNELEYEKPTEKIVYII